jgi:outer membrane protein assembly factor BamB
VWTTAYDAGDPIAAAPVLAGDNLVVVTQKGDVHVVNRSSGLGARVPHPTNERATTCNAAVIAGMCYFDGVVYARSQDNVLHAINPLTRTVDYSFSLKMEVTR